jgi:hypothetical protein
MGKVVIHNSKISFPYCRPFGHEIDKNGMCTAAEYTDKSGRIRYCANPSHNHYYTGGCFIATVCYGADSDEVLVLKKFRDDFLLKYKIGEFFTDFYYKLSPIIARKIKRQIVIQGLFNVILRPIIHIVRKLIKKSNSQ